MLSGFDNNSCVTARNVAPVQTPANLTTVSPRVLLCAIVPDLRSAPSLIVIGTLRPIVPLYTGGGFAWGIVSLKSSFVAKRALKVAGVFFVPKPPNVTVAPLGAVLILIPPTPGMYLSWLCACTSRCAVGFDDRCSLGI